MTKTDSPEQAFGNITLDVPLALKINYYIKAVANLSMRI